MLLEKSCKKSRHANNGTIRLGTFHEYRETEIQQIVDKEEGIIKLYLNFEGDVKISLELFDAISPDLKIGKTSPPIFPRKTKSFFHNLSYTQPDEDHVILNNVSATIITEAYNGFVFCMSKASHAGEFVGRFPEYDDYWNISESSIVEFGDTLGHILLEEIGTQRTKGNHIIPEKIPLESIELFSLTSSITYMEREIRVTNEEPLSIEDTQQLLSHIEFIKPIKYEPEKEFRYHYLLIANGKLIEPNAKFLIVNSEKLRKYIL
ncbi:hypothetical protein D3C76_802670 [compost metagenome]